jgi:diadenylate cyclase
MFLRLQQLLSSYHWYEVVIELAVIWFCVYLIVRFLSGTRGAGVIKGVFVLLIVLTLGLRVLGEATDAFGRLNFIYERFLGLLAILLAVVFQPELRHAMIRLGRAKFLRTSRTHVNQVVEAVSEAVEFLSRNQFGALIAIEREVKLGGLVEVGQEIDAKVSARLLESIFWPNSPLHDLGVVIRGDRIAAAGVQFPLVEEGALGTEFGSRHRAAAGLSQESDCLVVIVSEERGTISLSEAGRIDYDLPREHFRETLSMRLAARVVRRPEVQLDSEPDQSAVVETLTESIPPAESKRSVA